MSRVRTFDQEVWAGSRVGRVVEGDRITIARDDRGLTWRLSAKANTYTESPRKPATAAPPPPQALDMRTAGWEWEAAYSWSTKESGQQGTLLGRPCREFVADGDADYAEARVTFWACEALPGAPAAPNDAVLSRLRSDSCRAMILDTLAAHGGLWVLQVEEKQEPAIAPTLIIRARAEKLEVVTVSAGLFELPADARKAEVK